MKMVNYNGKILRSDELKLSPENRAFYFGDGFFEVIRLIHGYPVFLDDHIDRIHRSFQFLNLNTPFKAEKEDLLKIILELAELNKVLEGGVFKISFFREAAGYYTPVSDTCGFVAECTSLKQNLYKINPKGLHLVLYTQNYKPVQPLYTLKSLNTLIYVLAGVYARNNKCDDALILNDYETIIETTGSNLFIVKNGTIITPGLDEGCVPGIMRKNVLKLIEYKSDFSVEKGVILQSDILEADEVFITDVIHGIRWVVALKEKRYFKNVSEKLTKMLKEQFA